MSSSITIVQANSNDLDSIVEIEQNCFDLPWDRNALRHELSGLSWSRTFLALANEEPAGYVCFWTIAGEYQILKVAVRGEFQRQRIGRQMIDHIKILAADENIHIISLELRAKNIIARNLYESCGFSKVGTRRKYYSDTGDDAILMNYVPKAK